MTINEIMEDADAGYCYSSYYKCAASLQKEGYIEAGIKDKRAAAYYITNKGIEFKEELE